MTAEHAVDSEWRRALLPLGATLRDAIRNLETTGLQISLVVAADEKLVGTLTDGDIRRGILRGLTLESAVDSVVQRAPLVVPPQLGHETVLQLMQANRVHQVPVVDAERNILGLHVWEELVAPSPRLNVMVIMAGGRGTRLRPQTEACPKPLLPVAGKPMLEHIIERARGEGIRRFLVAIHYLGEMIVEHFGDGSRLQVQIDYLREETPLGTAGALALISPRPDLPLVVSNGDVITDVRFGELLEFHSQHAATATMAVRQYEWQHPFGVVRTQGVDIVGFEEKPVTRSHINAGVYALEPAALDLLVRGEHCDMPALFLRLQERRHRTIAYPMHEPWLDVGRADDLSAADTLELRPYDADEA